jgi:hypothetical protein
MIAPPPPNPYPHPHTHTQTVCVDIFVTRSTRSSTQTWLSGVAG